MAETTHATLLALCADLQEAGIWLTFNAANALVVGPTETVKKAPKLLARVREHKTHLVQLLEDSLAHDVFGTKADDPRFEREVCPDCQQTCLIVLQPRRLGVHRLPGTSEMCPGSDRAQTATAETIMQAFLHDRCEHRPQALLSWISIKGALESWCLERTFFLPPRPFIIAWLDKHFVRHGDDDRPLWQGLTLNLPEWGFDDPEPEPAQPVLLDTPPAPPRRKGVLRA